MATWGERAWWKVAALSGLGAAAVVPALILVPSQLFRLSFGTGLLVFIIVLLRDPKRRFFRAGWMILGAWMSRTAVPGINFQMEGPQWLVKFLTGDLPVAFHVAAAGLTGFCFWLDLLQDQSSNQIVGNPRSGLTEAYFRNNWPRLSRHLYGHIEDSESWCFKLQEQLQEGNRWKQLPLRFKLHDPGLDGNIDLSYDSSFEAKATAYKPKCDELLVACQKYNELVNPATEHFHTILRRYFDLHEIIASAPDEVRKELEQDGREKFEELKKLIAYYGLSMGITLDDLRNHPKYQKDVDEHHALVFEKITHVRESIPHLKQQLDFYDGAFGYAHDNE